MSRIILFQILFFFFATTGWEFDGIQTTTPMIGDVPEEIRWGILEDYNADANASGWPNVATAGQFVWNAAEENKRMLPAVKNAWEAIQRDPNQTCKSCNSVQDNLQPAVTEAAWDIVQNQPAKRAGMDPLVRG